MEEYKSIDSKEVEFTTISEEEKLSKMTPLERIKHTASKFNIQLKDPKRGCKTCFGRGYKGFVIGTDRPVACHCINPDMNEETKHAYENRMFVPRNRKERRMIEKLN